MNEDFINKIKSRGYWRINFTPLGPPQAKSMSQLKTIVRDSQVQLRGWYYPFFRDNNDNHYGLANHNAYLEGWIDWEEYKEFWRLYRSGQYIHYDVVHEDWYGSRDAMGKHVEPGKYLGFIGSLTYYITEILEFLSRLNRVGLYPEGVQLSIELHNTEGRQLESFESARFLPFPKITHQDPIVFKRKYTPKDFDDSAANLAIEPIVYFFEMFDFEGVSIDSVIKKDQETLYGYNGGRRD